MGEIHTERLALRPFREADYDDLFEFLYQLRDDEFEGCPGITYENGREHGHNSKCVERHGDRCRGGRHVALDKRRYNPSVYRDSL